MSTASWTGSEVTDLIGKDAFYETLIDVEAAYRATLSDNKP